MRCQLALRRWVELRVRQRASGAGLGPRERTRGAQTLALHLLRGQVSPEVLRQKLRWLLR